MIEQKFKGMCNVKTSFEKIAKAFDKTRNRAWNEVLEFSKTLEKNAIILDLGCGNARNSIAIAKNEKNKNFKFVCMDISKNMIKIAKEKAKKENLSSQFTFLIANGENIPLKDNSVDAVLSIAVFHHLKREKEKKFASEIHRVLKKNGKIILSVWKKDQILGKNHRKLNNKEVIIFWGSEKIPVYYRIISKENLEKAFEMFSNIEIWESDRNIWLKGKK